MFSSLADAEASGESTSRVLRRNVESLRARPDSGVPERGDESMWVLIVAVVGVLSVGLLMGFVLRALLA